MRPGNSASSLSVLIAGGMILLVLLILALPLTWGSLIGPRPISGVPLDQVKAKTQTGSTSTVPHHQHQEEIGDTPGNLARAV